jgi:hypothetical protein
MTDEKFIKKWGERRKKGRFLYVVVFGFLILGVLSGTAFLIISVLIEQATKPEFVLNEYVHTGKFLVRLLISYIIFPIAGFFIGLSNWKSNERKYKTLVRYFSTGS